MEHLSKEKLNKYVTHELAADEMTGAILHLDECRACFENLQNILATQSETAESFTFFDEETEKFHLDYDEHLRPFVDHEADAATREIVESHTRQCAMCAAELRDLREFAESLKWREQQKNALPELSFFSKFKVWLKRAAGDSAAQWAFALALILLAAGSVIYWLNRAKPDLANENMPPEIAHVYPPPENKLENKTAENSPANMAVSNIRANKQTATAKPEATKPPSTENNASAKAEKPASLPKSVTKTPAENSDFARLENLPPEFRATVRTALSTETLQFPPFLAEWRENLKLRGESGAKSIKMNPGGEAVRESQPKFRWANFAKKGEKYVVEIIDESNDSVAVSPPLKQAAWRVPVPLPRGKVYQWEVRTKKTDASPAVKSFAAAFQVSDKNTLADLSKMAGKPPLVRGIAYASAGFLSEAKREFRQAIKENKDAAKARKFLLQIERQK